MVAVWLTCPAVVRYPVMSATMPRISLSSTGPSHTNVSNKNTHHLLPTGGLQLQAELHNLEGYSRTHQMQINTEKTKVMIFNPARNYDGTPQLTLSDMGGEHLEVVEKYKLLGVIIRSDLKWQDNTDFICQKGYARLWLLRRLKGLGANMLEMLDVYEKQVRTVLEMAVPVWQPALTKQESVQIERVQRCAF